MKWLIVPLAVAALAGCGSSSNSSTSSSSSKTTASANSSGSGGGYGGAYGSSSSSKKSASNAAAQTTVHMTMADYKFGPKTITGKPGSTVKVLLNNTSASEHNFKIDGQKAADADVAPGKSGTALVKIPKSGSLQFYCEYHKGLGMVGTVKAS